MISGMRVQGSWLAIGLFLARFGFAAAGQEGANFLEIPVGARPAALGGAYTALADDSYAPLWNPGGLGAVDGIQLSGMHVAYLEDVNYEQLGFAVPLGAAGAIGGSVQYLRPGDIAGRNASGDSIGDISGRYGAYTAAYGLRLGPTLSVGASAKMIEASLSDVSARAYAVDAGALWHPLSAVRLGAVASNMGTRLKFIQQSDSLPWTFRLAGAVDLTRALTWVAQGDYTKSASGSFHTGVEWSPASVIALRAGYRTDTTTGLSAEAGLAAGLGLRLWGQELDYAWEPMGDLGTTQYLSLVLRFSGARDNHRNLVKLPRTEPKYVTEAPPAVDPSLLDLENESVAQKKAAP